MTTLISLFNNKGGVGKTTFLFHVAHYLADEGVTVLMVDCDSQCNLTAYALNDKAIEKAWEDSVDVPLAKGEGQDCLVAGPFCCPKDHRSTDVAAAGGWQDRETRDVLYADR